MQVESIRRLDVLRAGVQARRLQLASLKDQLKDNDDPYFNRLLKSTASSLDEFEDLFLDSFERDSFPRPVEYEIRFLNLAEHWLTEVIGSEIRLIQDPIEKYGPRVVALTRR